MIVKVTTHDRVLDRYSSAIFENGPTERGQTGVRRATINSHFQLEPGEPRPAVQPDIEGR
jgi:hypothetical protein